MGGTTFTQTSYGTNVGEVFGALVNEAISYYGWDPYNGSISTTSLGCEIDLKKYPKLEKALKKNDWETIDEYDEILHPEKRISTYIKELAYYNAFEPKWYNIKETVIRKKGVQKLKRFVVVQKSKLNERLPFGTQVFETISDAKKAAKAKSLMTKENVYVLQMRSDNSKVKVGTFELLTDGKQFKSQRQSKTKVYLPVYKFTFFVFAAE